jgi:hypothetical protein
MQAIDSRAHIFKQKVVALTQNAESTNDNAVASNAEQPTPYFDTDLLLPTPPQPQQDLVVTKKRPHVAIAEPTDSPSIDIDLLLPTPLEQ